LKITPTAINQHTVLQTDM